MSRSFITFLAVVTAISWTEIKCESVTETKLTVEQLVAIAQTYIDEVKGKRCLNNIISKSYDYQCKDYCWNMYYYAPGLPYNNARIYNPVTKLCEPEKRCPLQPGVRFDSTLNLCRSMQNSTVPFIGTAPPSPIIFQYRVKIRCVNGQPIIWYGYNDCRCNQGWDSNPTITFEPTPGTYSVEKLVLGLDAQLEGVYLIIKCQIAVKPERYKSNFNKIEYDESQDLQFPRDNNPNYWFCALEYLMRNLRNAIVGFFIPPEIQIIRQMLPDQDQVNYINIWTAIRTLVAVAIIILLIKLLVFCRPKNSTDDE